MYFFVVLQVNRNLTNALHRIAARLRIQLNLRGHGWAARGDRERWT